MPCHCQPLREALERISKHVDVNYTPILELRIETPTVAASISQEALAAHQCTAKTEEEITKAAAKYAVDTDEVFEYAKDWSEVVEIFQAGARFAQQLTKKEK